MHAPRAQVFVMEDEEQRTSFRNLSIHRANNEEEALNLVGSKGVGKARHRNQQGSGQARHHNQVACDCTCAAPCVKP